MSMWQIKTFESSIHDPAPAWYSYEVDVLNECMYVLIGWAVLHSIGWTGEQEGGGEESVLGGAAARKSAL